MSEIISCLTKAVGLTRNDELKGFDSASTESLSGLYIDELQGMPSLASSICEELWVKLERARSNAIQLLRTDIAQELDKYLEQNRRPFSGLIGTVQYNQLSQTKSYHGARLYTNLTGVNIKITGITFLPPASGDYNLLLVDDWGTETVIPIPNCIAKRPMAVNFTHFMRQGNTYLLINGSSAYRVKLGCCGYKWYFNQKNPAYSISKSGWTRWIMAAGVTGDDLDSKEDWALSSQLYGLAIHTSMGCNSDSMLCSEYTDFTYNEVDRSVAFAIQYKAGELFLTSLLDGENINRTTLLGMESVEPIRQEYSNRYRVMVEYAAQNIDYSRSDCYDCRYRSRMVNTSVRYGR